MLQDEVSCQGRGLDKCYPDLGENPINVQGQAISPNTIVYYYTYGSVLAALSRPRANKCGEAMKVLNDVSTELNTNPDAYTDGRQTIQSIVDAGVAICQSLADDNAPTSSVPTEAVTSTPEAGMIEITATPYPN